MVFSLLRSADEPGIISHVDGAEIDVLTVHLADDERKTGTTAITTTSQTFAALSWSECAGHALLGGVINVVLVQCAQSLLRTSLYPRCTAHLSQEPVVR